jgi:hypothetical protein
LISPAFAIAFVAFPFFEAMLLLAAVNWSWHAFLDPNDPENEYVQRITIVDGMINVLNEDFHVVHHQFPGAHWTDHPNHKEKVWNKSIDNRASCFRKTHAFEVFGMSVARDYDGLATKFVDLKGERDGCPMTHDERVDLIKQRLRVVVGGGLESQRNRLRKSKRKNEMVCVPTLRVKCALASRLDLS